MRMLSEDDVNIEKLTADELDLAWDLWFDLAQATNDADPPYTHGVFAGLAASDRLATLRKTGMATGDTPASSS